MRISDWSSDVCSSDLPARPGEQPEAGEGPLERAHRRGGVDRAGRGRRRSPLCPSCCESEGRNMGVRHGYSVYRDARWPPLRLKAKRRDGFKCTNCGARGRLEVHHKIPVRQAPELAFELGNVTCLCPTCHTKETRRELGLEPNQTGRAGGRE